MTVADLPDWFPDDELAVCPGCSRDTAFATKAAGYQLCLECGLLAPNGAPVGRALALVPPLEADRQGTEGAGTTPRLASSVARAPARAARRAALA